MSEHDGANAERRDYRLYVPHNDGWEGRVKPDSTKEYCYMKSPGEDYYHLLQLGEIYVQRGNEKICLTCALRNGVITENRLHWQHPPKSKPMPI